MMTKNVEIEQQLLLLPTMDVVRVTVFPLARGITS
jgi:hypothetical protein